MPPAVLTLLKLQANERFHDIALDRDDLELLLMAANTRVSLLVELDEQLEAAIDELLGGRLGSV